MKKRLISVMLILCMMLSAIPGGFAYHADAAAPDAGVPLAQNRTEAAMPSALGSGSTVTRAQWVQSLVKAFDMTVEEAHAPDNYFSDLTGEESYYRDILVAVQFGVVDIPAGDAFRPEEAATREFAAQTLNACLGFLPSGDEGYTFSEAESVTYPDAIQIAIDRGWFALSGSSFLPDQAITEAESAKMLSDAAAVLESRVINTSYRNTYTFRKDVIEIPAGTNVEILSNTVVIENCPKALKSGDIFVVWYQSVPCAFVAGTVATDGALTTIDATTVSDGSAVTDADAQGILDAEFAQFVPDEGTEVVYVDEVTGTEYTDAREADRAIAAHQATRGTKKLKTLQLKKDITLSSGQSVTVKAAVKNPVLTYKFSLRNKYASVILRADYEVGLSASVDLTDALLVKKLRLGFWGCPGIGGIDLNVLYNIGGSVKGSYSGSMCIGAEYRSGSGFSTPRDFRSKGFSFVIEASLKAGMQVSLGINDVPCDMLVGNVYAEFGVKGSVNRTSYSDNAAPRVCLHTAMYLYLETGLHLSYKFGNQSDNRDQSESVWSESTSPVRVVHHYEDGKEVCVCTRGMSHGSGGYYTPGSSNYWNSGWSGGMGGTGYDRSGNPMPIYEYTVEGGNNAVITKYNGSGASVTIPKTIDGHTVIAIGENAFSHNTALRSVSVPDTVTVIRGFAFYGCTALQTVDLPDSITEIAYHAFSECKSLEWVALPNRIKTLGGCAFAGCDSLKSVRIPKSLTTADTYTSSYYGPFHRSGLVRAAFEAGTTSVVPNLFRGANKLKTVELPDTVTAIGANAFDGCAALQAVRIPDSVTSLGNFAFRGCAALRTLELSKAVTSLGEYAFSGCSSLQAVSLPDSVVTLGAHAFSYCTALERIELSKRLRQLGGCAFTGCDSLKSVRIPKSLTTAGTYTSYRYGPFHQSGLESVTFEAGTTSVVPNLFCGADKLKTVELPDTVTAIGANAFESCTSLTSVEIPESVTQIADRAFKYCTALRSFRLPVGVTKLGVSVWEGCSSLASFTWDSSIQVIPEMTFFQCTKLTDFAVPDCITEIHRCAFWSCTALASVTGGQQVAAIGESAFGSCTALVRIEFSPVLRSVGAKAFQGCTALTSVELPEGVTSVAAFGFQNCTALTSVTIPDSLSALGEYAFDGCAALTDVRLGSGLTKIPVRAFGNCSALETVVLPYRIEQIADNAFLNTVKLQSITIPRRTTVIASNAFSYPFNLTVYGVAGTYAETYADEIGAAFVAIDKPAMAVSLHQTALTVNRYQSVSLTASITPTDFTDEVAWKTDNAAVATVNDAGVVTAVGIGECTISFAAGNVKATCKITVVQPVTGISLNKTSVSLDAGQTCQLTATVYPADAANRAVAWSSSDESVASVSADGLVTARKKGTATITATAKDGSGIARSCTVTVLGDLIVCPTVEELQSPHPYAANCNDVWQYTIPGAANLLITFSAETSVESGSDYLYLYGADGAQIGKYTSAELAGKTVTIPGDTVRIKLVSDSTYCEYGFAVTSAVSGERHTHTYRETVVAPTCTEQGYTVHVCTGCGDSYTDTYLAATGNAWSAPTYTWSADYGKVTARRICAHDASHTESEAGTVRSAVTKQATYDAEGEITYTATFRSAAFATQTKTVKTPKLQKPAGNPFTDVKSGSYYYDAVLWAVANNVTAGTSATTFSPEDGCTRAQVVTFLWRAAGTPEPTSGSNPFSDVTAGTYYYKAVLWAVEKGITAGTSATTFSPDDTCTRAQIVTFLWRYEGKPATASVRNPFVDVKAGDYYAEAVLWAAENGVTAGTSATTFSPDDTCTRAQVVTFLYRDVAE